MSGSGSEAEGDNKIEESESSREKYVLTGVGQAHIGSLEELTYPDFSPLETREDAIEYLKANNPDWIEKKEVEDKEPVIDRATGRPVKLEIAFNFNELKERVDTLFQKDRLDSVARSRIYRELNKLEEELNDVGIFGEGE